MASDDAPRITWVPQVFFDLIARVIPGTIAIGALVIASCGPSRSLYFLEQWLRDPPGNSPAVLVIILTLVLSYALAIVLWGIGFFIAGILRKGIEPETGVKDSGGEFSIQYDFIKKNDPQAGNRITKLKAEIHLAAVLVVGLSISLLVDGLMSIDDFSKDRVVFGGLLVLAIAGSASSWRFFVHRTAAAVKNQCRLLCYAEWCIVPRRGSVIVRMWHGRTPAAKADEYLAFLHRRALPDYRGTPGNLAAYILRRADGDVTHFTTVTHWESLQAIEAFAGADISRAKYYPEDSGYLLEFELTVQHSELYT